MGLDPVNCYVLNTVNTVVNLTALLKEDRDLTALNCSLISGMCPHATKITLIRIDSPFVDAHFLLHLPHTSSGLLSNSADLSGETSEEGIFFGFPAVDIDELTQSN